MREPEEGSSCKSECELNVTELVVWRGRISRLVDLHVVDDDVLKLMRETAVDRSAVNRLWVAEVVHQGCLGSLQQGAEFRKLC